MEADLTLYQNPWVQASVARVYAHVLLFLRKAVNWYNAKRLHRVVHSVVHPLKFQDTVAEIKKCIMDVDANANTSSHVEIRGLTLALQAQAAKLHQSDQRLHDMQTKMNEAQAHNEMWFKQCIQVVTSESCMTVLRS